MWFFEKAMTNILSLAVVKREYQVRYDEDYFIIHRAKHRYPDMVFKPHSSGLHVLDVNDSQSHASYSFVETVAENMLMFTKHQIESDQQARRVRLSIDFPILSELSKPTCRKIVL